MAVTLVTGKLGGGKTLVSVGKMQEALFAGRRVASNLDITIEKLLPAQSRKVQLVRLPDKPCLADLELLGVGNESMDESQNGLIVLDELATWLNARSWGDKDRQAVIDWLVHSRKFGWDVIFICQHPNQIDKQVRESLVEFLVTCRRLDRLKIPFIGGLIKLCTGGLLSGRMPRIHIGICRYGTATDSVVADRWIYRGVELYPAYNTRQVFSDKYSDGVYSYLSPWHLVGRFRISVFEQLRRWWTGWERLQRLRVRPAARLGPLMALAPDVRMAAAKRLLALGFLEGNSTVH